jgi:hypothetical protein
VLTALLGICRVKGKFLALLQQDPSLLQLQQQPSQKQQLCHSAPHMYVADELHQTIHLAKIAMDALTLRSL